MTWLDWIIVGVIWSLPIWVWLVKRRIDWRRRGW
jgi:hypothetical protein